MTHLNEYFSKDNYASHLGIELTETGPGYASAKMNLSNEHLNAYATVHGGAIFSLADFVCAVAANSYGKVALTVNMSITYLKSAKEGVLFAEARELSCPKKLASYCVTVKDQDGQAIASAQATVYRKDEENEIDDPYPITCS